MDFTAPSATLLSLNPTTGLLPVSIAGHPVGDGVISEQSHKALLLPFPQERLIRG